MKRFLHWLVDFVDRKFPDRVVVTTDMYRQHERREVEMQTRLIALERKITGMEEPTVDLKPLEEKIQALQNDVTRLNFAMGYSASPLKPNGTAVLER